MGEIRANVKLENDDVERVTLIGSKNLQVQGTNKMVIIQEFCYNKPELKRDSVSFSLFVFNDTRLRLD